MTRHKHANVIIAWAEGQEIQFRYTGKEWIDFSTDLGLEHFGVEGAEFRIKPIAETRYYFIDEVGYIKRTSSIDRDADFVLKFQDNVLVGAEVME